MTRIQLVLIGVAFAIVAGLIVAVSWVQYRAQPDTAVWGDTVAAVTSHRTINLNRGTATVVHVQYTVSDAVQEADLEFIRDVWDGQRFVTPPDTPGVGDAIALKYDPSNPSTVVPADQPPSPFMGVWKLIFVATLSLLALLCWIVPVGR